MVSAARDRVEGTIERIRRSDDSCARSLAALRRTRYRLRGLRGGDGTPDLPDLSRVSVVIVEEDSDNLEIFATFLRACGAHVLATRTVEFALRYLAVAPVDVIMTDTSVLPEDGERFSDAVRRIARHGDTPILAVTGWSKKDVGEANGGFTSFMQKPIDLDRLAAEILRLVPAAPSAH